MPGLNKGAALKALFGRADTRESGIGWGAHIPVTVTLPLLNAKPVLRVQRQDTGQVVLERELSVGMVFSVSPSVRLLKAGAGKGHDETYALQFHAVADAEELSSTLEAASTWALSNVFDRKTDKGSSELYFHYYGMLMHQQNMLQDYTRTGTYYAAILENRPDFEGKVVMDVGAGSGILSLFAAQAGARKVYAMEASGMAKFARQLADSNPGCVEVIHSKVEEAVVPEMVDVLVSEPMGTLLVNERMLETYLYARDHFLKPGGKMFPQVGRIHVAAFSDEALYSELLGRATFWMQNNFYGVDVTSLHKPALEGYFSQVVVDAFDTQLLVSNCATRVFDFATCTEAELQDIAIPLNLQVPQPCMLHGLACWFDVLFNGSLAPRYLSTAPGLPTTHWFQLRCVLQQPLYISAPNSVVTGELRLIAHARQSYDVHITLTAPPLRPNGPLQTASCKLDLKEPYYRQLTTWYQQPHSTPSSQQPSASPQASPTQQQQQHQQPPPQQPPPPQHSAQQAGRGGQQQPVGGPMQGGPPPPQQQQQPQGFGPEQAAGVLQQLQHQQPHGFNMEAAAGALHQMQHAAALQQQQQQGYGYQQPGGQHAAAAAGPMPGVPQPPGGGPGQAGPMQNGVMAGEQPPPPRGGGPGTSPASRQQQQQQPLAVMLAQQQQAAEAAASMRNFQGERPYMQLQGGYQQAGYAQQPGYASPGPSPTRGTAPQGGGAPWQQQQQQQQPPAQQRPARGGHHRNGPRHHGGPPGGSPGTNGYGGRHSNQGPPMP